MDSISQTYVFEGVEVFKTGRTASRKLRTRERVLMLIEIQPVDRTFTWKKWVNELELYIVDSK